MKQIQPAERPFLIGHPEMWARVRMVGWEVSEGKMAEKLIALQ